MPHPGSARAQQQLRLSVSQELRFVNDPQWWFVTAVSTLLPAAADFLSGRIRFG
jgi:hypothetical protein